MEKEYRISELYNFSISNGNTILENSILLLKNIENREIPFYITFDIDVIDSIYAPATATPVINGIKPNEIFSILEQIKQLNLNIIGIDFVEINPNLDEGNTTMQLSVYIIKNLLNLMN